MRIGGSILDLGCGSGSTANELSGTAYQVYTGVDISDVALENAKKRTEENRRGDKNRYFQSNIFSYVPTRRYAARWIYSNYLKERGVFIVVRMCNGSDKYKLIVDTIESNFEVVERYLSDRPKAVVIVLRQGCRLERAPVEERPPTAATGENH